MSESPPVDALSLAQRAVSAPRRKPLRWLVRFAFGLVVAAWSLMLIGWLSLHWFILPHIQQWRQPIEARASAALGVAVRIGGIEVRSSSWVPALELKDVVLLDSAERVVLRLPRIVASLSPRSLLDLDLRFEQLLIDGAELEARRDALGRITIAGLDFGAKGGTDDGAAADWFFKQGEFVIRGGALRWTDEQRAAPPLALTDVQLVVRNGVRRHEMRLDATPPAGWGDRFSLQGSFTAPLLSRGADWRGWSGTAYVDLPRADVRELRQHVNLPFDLSEGNGALRGWFEIKNGEPHAATVDLALREVALRLDPTVEALTFEQIEGRLEARRDANGVALALRHFSFLTGDDIRWPQGDLTLNLRQRDGEAATGGDFSAQRIDVAVVAQVASRVPLGVPLRKLLADVDPKGSLTDLVAKWDGPLDAPERYQVNGLLSGLSLQPRAAPVAHDLGRPGLRNAVLQLNANEKGGNARIAVDAGAVDLPGVFADPLVPLDRLSAHLLWKIEPPKTGTAPAKLTVQLKDAKFGNADAQGELAGTWSSGDPADSAHGGRYPGRLELDGRIESALATRVARYLPLGVPEATRHYLESAIRGGSVKGVSIRVKGHLRDFPFYNGRAGKDGEFRIALQTEDVGFAFIPDSAEWPVLAQVAGELVIDRSTLEIRNARAQLGAIEWTRVHAGIANLAERPVLKLEASAKGPLPEMVKVVNATPIGGWIGKALATASTTGPADLKFALAVPLTAVSTTTVNGSVLLAGNDVRISADTPLLGGAKGRVDFSEKGFAIVGGSARVLGGDAKFDGGLQSDDSIRFTGQGTATAEALRLAVELGPVARIAGAMSGQTPYRLNLGFVHGRPQLLVTSNLVGLGVDLPYPLGKPAAAALEMRYQTATVDERGASLQGGRERLRLDIGNVLQASYLRESSGDSSRVVQGGIGVLAPAPSQATGVGAYLNLQRLDVDAWEAAYNKLFGAGSGAIAVAGGGAAMTATLPASGAVPAGPVGSQLLGTAPPSAFPASVAPLPTAGGSDDYVPTTVALRTQELRSGSRRLTDVVVGASSAGGLWRANVSADQLDGYIEYRASRGSAAQGPGPAGRIYARLSRLSLPKSDVGAVETLGDSHPASTPGLDIVVEDFELRGKHLGRVEVEAANRVLREPGRPPVREWQLSKLNLTLPEAQLTATGSWGVAPGSTSAGASRRAMLDFKLAVNDSGALLDRLGVGKAIRGGKGELSGQVSWAGSPLSLDYPSLAGRVNVAIDSGQFLKAEPGAARLLSVLSLQSLPRRLVFDFRDLFDAGFAFDNVSGDLAIAEGVARTNNLRMRGPAAVVLMEGSADIARETQDLRVVIVPEINAGTASLAYAIINPAIGIGTFLAQYFLRKPMIEAGTRELRVSGRWDDPKVDRVERKRAQSVSAAEPMPPASSPNQ